MNRRDESTNLWALHKSPRLKAMLVLLEEQLGPEGVNVESATQTAPDGVWLAHRFDPEVRAYLYVHGQQEGTAGVHLEYPKLVGRPPVFDFSENVAPDQLAEILAAHFDISRINPSRWSNV